MLCYRKQLFYWQKTYCSSSKCRPWPYIMATYQSQVGAPLRSIVEQLRIIYFINDSVTEIRFSINLLYCCYVSNSIINVNAYLIVLTSHKNMIKNWTMIHEQFIHKGVMFEGLVKCWLRNVHCQIFYSYLGQEQYPNNYTENIKGLNSLGNDSWNSLGNDSLSFTGKVWRVG